MRRWFHKWLGLGTGLGLALSVLSPAFAGADKVDFLVAGKTRNYRQTGDAEPVLLNYHMFAEIFLKPGGAVSAPVLVTPAGRQLPFLGDASVLEAHGGRYATKDILNNAFPDGDYLIQYDGANHSLRLREDASQALPDAIVITLSQDGRRIAPQSVRSGVDLTISWSPFESGAADPNRIVDDLIFVVFGDCAGNRLLHSGAPFTGKPYLTYGARSLVVPAALIESGRTYQISVEHAKLRTAYSAGIPTLATFATSSFLDLVTDGAAMATDCQPIDKGQTDRYDSWKEIP